MRKELEEIRRIEKFLLGPMVPKWWSAPKEKIVYQKIAYRLIYQIGRQELKTELEDIHHNLVRKPEKKKFQKGIKRIYRLTIMDLNEY